MDPFDWLLVPGIPALALWIVYMVRRHIARVALERNALMESWGQKYGLKIMDRPSASPKILGKIITGVAPPFHMLEPRLVDNLKGTTYTFAHNFLEGQIEGRQVWVFDHRLIVRSRQYPYELRDHTVVAVEVKKPAPEFSVRPQRFWDNVTALLGHRDIQIGNEGFDKKYYISSTDEPSLRKLFDHDVIDLLFYHDEISWHCVKGFVVLSVFGQSDTENLSRMLEYATYLADKVDSC